jgi:predicted transcriptional regulator
MGRGAETDAKRAAVQDGIAAAVSGRLVPHGRVRKWLLSWGSANPLARPQSELESDD